MSKPWSLEHPLTLCRYLGSSFHEDADIGGSAAGTNKMTEIVVSDVSHLFDLHTLSTGHRYHVTVNHFDGHIDTVPFPLVPYHTPGKI